MLRRASLFKHATLIVLTLLVARGYCANALPRCEAQVTTRTPSLLRFDQSITLADFDGDDRVDQATLSGVGRSKKIEIRLSRTTALNFLRFDTLTSERGSLFARDIDNDGDNDLIWSDLLHPDDVVVWLDDGGGRFERVCPQQYAESFVLSDESAFDGVEIPHQDSASSPRQDPALALPDSKFELSAPGRIYNSQRRSLERNGILRLPFDRGPPAIS